MTLAIVITLLVSLVTVVGVALWAVTRIVADHQEFLTSQAQKHHAERMALIDERDALLERIQRPEYRPTTRRDETDLFEAMDLPEVDMALVGTVVTEAVDAE